MHKRGARRALVALLLAIGGAAAVLSLDVDRKLRALSVAERDRAQRIDAMMAALADIALAQHGYVALGSAPTPPEALVASLLRQFDTDATALRRTATSPDAARILEAEHRLYPEAIARVLDGGWRIEGRRLVLGPMAS